MAGSVMMPVVLTEPAPREKQVLTPEAQHWAPVTSIEPWQRLCVHRGVGALISDSRLRLWTLFSHFKFGNEQKEKQKQNPVIKTIVSTGAGGGAGKRLMRQESFNFTIAKSSFLWSFPQK